MHRRSATAAVQLGEVRRRSVAQPTWPGVLSVRPAIGMPEPQRTETFLACLAAVRRHGAVPAVTAVLDGRPVVGVAEQRHAELLAATHRVNLGGLPVAVATNVDVAVTTVSAAVALAATAGIRFFATGGIGGVHRDGDHAGDVSADLAAISRFPVGVVCSGAKAFLDLARTLQRLESLGVAVVGLGTDQFPGFWTARSGLSIPSVDDRGAIDAVAVTAAIGHGAIVAVPPPRDAELDAATVDAAIERARHHDDGASGSTPRILAEIARATGGAATRTNAALLVANAGHAARLATLAAS
ncbi:MAG TPA: pseudouridine-5'-phosphate glycosidase [Ilumatobacter sp.]|nr:pseudouridine-5'-phosphate glycosidase [Ilumatobacter sp.]